jgi:outer membrane protein assembly factor BamE
MQRTRTAGLLAGAMLPMWMLSGCASTASDSFLGVVTPYRMEIVQGNVLTKEQVAAVAPGMARAQVRDLLGSPLLTSVFHADRWDYMFTLDRQGVEPQRRSVVVHFDGDRMTRIDVPELPSEQEFVASISTARPSGTPPVLELTEEQRKALPVPARRQAAPTLPTGPVRDYPPLEPR